MKYYFIRIPRTASGSMKAILGSEGHKRASTLKRDASDWDERWKFTFVRHPFERFLSGWYHFHFDETVGDPNIYLAKHGMQGEKTQNRLTVFRPMVDYICIDGEIALDYIGRYEYLDIGWNIVCGKLGINESLPHKNKTEVKKHVLNKKSKDILRDYYRDDFNVFKYNY